MSRILSTGGGVYTHPRQTLPRQTPPQADPPLPRRPLQRTVRILLECIFVHHIYKIYPQTDVAWIICVKLLIMITINQFLGLTLMHYAAMYNRPQLIAVLIQQVMDINARKSSNFQTGSKCSMGKEDLSKVKAKRF